MIMNQFPFDQGKYITLSLVNNLVNQSKNGWSRNNLFVAWPRMLTICSFFSEGVHSNKQTNDQYFFEIGFLFEFCFSLHGMQYVLLSHTATGKYYFNFSGSMVPNFHGTA